MNWKQKIKKLQPDTMLNPRKDPLVERAKSAWKKQEGGYNKPPKKPQKMDYPSTRDKCKIETCYAVTCKYNKDKDCILPTVTLSKDAVCQDFTPPEETDLSTKE